MLLPALVAGATGYLGFVAVNGTAPLFAVHGTPALSFVDLAGAAALGLAAAFGARAVRVVARARRSTLRPRRHPVALRVTAAAASVAGLFAIGRLLTGESLVLTPGYGVVTWALDPKRSVALLLAILVLRCLATGATVAGGGVGGLFVPLVVAGALLGPRVRGVVGPVDNSLFVVVGIAAFLGAGYRVPLAAVMFVAETTGRPGFIVPGLIAAVVAELCMGNASVTAYQVRPATGDGATSNRRRARDERRARRSGPAGRAGDVVLARRVRTGRDSAPPAKRSAIQWIMSVADGAITPAWLWPGIDPPFEVLADAAQVRREELRRHDRDLLVVAALDDEQRRRLLGA